MSCLYCCEAFDLDTHLPILLDCSHSLCKECVSNLGETMRKCPFHNTQTKYDVEKVNQAIVDDLRLLCEADNSKIIGICKVHFEEFCCKCEFKHRNCRKLTCSKENINHHLDEIINSALSKSLQISDKFKENEMIDFEDGIIWIEEHLAKLNEALNKIENALKNDYTVEFKLKVLNDFEYLVKDENLPEVEGENQIESSEKNNEILEKFSESELSLDFLKMFKQKVDDDVHLHFSKLKQDQIQTVKFFYHKKVNKSENDFSNYFCYFTQSCNNFLFVKGLGIGRPSKPGTSILISLLEVKIKTNSYVEEDIIIEYSPDSFMFHLALKNSFIMDKDEEVLVHLEIIGNENYLFSGPYMNLITAKGVDSQNFTEDFPVLYFIHD